MRITNGIIQNNMMSSLNKNMSSLNDLMIQMSTLKKIQTPSDDPIIAGRSMKLNVSIKEAEQHATNVDEAMSWMQVTESALDNTTEILKSIRDRFVQGSNGGALTVEDRETIAADIEQLYEQLKQEVNVTYAGRYVFSGYKTDQQVYLETPHTLKEDVTLTQDLTYPDGTVAPAGTVLPKGTELPAGMLNPEVLENVEGQNINYEIGVSNTIEVNVTGMPQFVQGLMADMEQVMTAIEGANAEPPTVTEEELNELFTGMIGEIDGHLQDVSRMTSDLGSRQARLEHTKARLDEDQMSLTTLLSNTEDIDIEEVYIEYNTQYMVYQSALQATSKVVVNTLADFLR